jgi:hypothetical protein
MSGVVLSMVFVRVAGTLSSCTGIQPAVAWDVLSGSRYQLFVIAVVSIESAVPKGSFPW